MDGATVGVDIASAGSPIGTMVGACAGIAVGDSAARLCSPSALVVALVDVGAALEDKDGATVGGNGIRAVAIVDADVGPMVGAIE
jgi:hypothetical protein